jgi:hypothetical protein
MFIQIVFEVVLGIVDWLEKSEAFFLKDPFLALYQQLLP